MYPAAVIFDFDGVIVDTEPIHYQAFQNLLTPLGLGYSWEEYTTRYMGFDDRDAFREAFRTHGKVIDENYLKELINLKASYFKKVVQQGVSPYPGVIELILELAENKVPLAISSGALHSDISPILNQLNIYNLFTQIITADDVPQSKPDPASYLLAKQRLLQNSPSKPNESSLIYAIEDTPAGIQSAQGAGLRVIGITNSYPAEKLFQADIIIDGLTELFGRPWP
jgi:HAD superfamily hydrolase (TIGR01509 family)